MKVLRSLFFLVLTFLLSLLVAFNIYHFVCMHFFHQELPNVFGYSLLEVVSGSMEPNIHIGDLIVIDRDDFDYQVGDIITFQDEYASFVTHRVVSLDEESVTTQGDANSSEDPSFSKDLVVGKLLFRLPGFGILLSSLQNPIVLLFIFLIGVLICYLISTDKDGNPILDEEEKEYVEFLEYRENITRDFKEPKLEKEKELFEGPFVILKDVGNAVPKDMLLPKLKSDEKERREHSTKKNQKRKSKGKRNR